MLLMLSSIAFHRRLVTTANPFSVAARIIDWARSVAEPSLLPACRIRRGSWGASLSRSGLGTESLLPRCARFERNLLQCGAPSSNNRAVYPFQFAVFSSRG